MPQQIPEHDLLVSVTLRGVQATNQRPRQSVTAHAAQASTARMLSWHIPENFSPFEDCIQSLSPNAKALAPEAGLRAKAAYPPQMH